MLLQTFSDSSDETHAIGQRLGAAALAGDIIALNGELGAGKTLLVQGIAVGLGAAADTVCSPTFALIAEHYGGRLPLYHMDAYRLHGAEDLRSIGFDDYTMRSDGVLAIEWAERIADALPHDLLMIRITVTYDSPNCRRQLDWKAIGPSAERLAGSATRQ